MAQVENLTAEELAAEQAATQEIKEEDVRAHVIKEYGFDETEDADRISKATAKEIENRKKLSQAIGQKIKYREAAKGAPPVTPPAVVPPVVQKESTLSEQDQRALIKADIPEEDIADVKEYATFKKISVAEALKSPILQATLSEKAAQRDTANATNTNSSRRGATKLSDDELVSQANAGKLPESDDEIARLMAARQPKPKKQS